MVTPLLLHQTNELQASASPRLRCCQRHRFVCNQTHSSLIMTMVLGAIEGVPFRAVHNNADSRSRSQSPHSIARI